jgi:hypothetical protein
VRGARRRAACAVTAIGVTLLATGCSDSVSGSGANGATDAPSDDTTAPVPTVADGATSDPGAGGPETCALLDGVDLSALLGEPVEDPEADGTVCRVAPADSDSRGQLGLVVETDRPADNFATQREVFGVDREVTGLGEAAFHSGPYLFVLDGDTFFFLQVVRDAAIGRGVPEGELEAAARTVLANLDG